MKSAVHSTKTMAIECVYTILERISCKKKRCKEEDDPGDLENGKVNHMIKQHGKEEAEKKRKKSAFIELRWS